MRRICACRYITCPCLIIDIYICRQRTRICTPACMYACKLAYLDLFVQKIRAYVWMCLYVNANVCICTCSLVRFSACRYARVCTDVCMYGYVHVRLYACACRCVCEHILVARIDRTQCTRILCIRIYQCTHARITDVCMYVCVHTI